MAKKLLKKYPKYHLKVFDSLLIGVSHGSIFISLREKDMGFEMCQRAHYS